jgi:hypothetical protein
VNGLFVDTTDAVIDVCEQAAIVDYAGTSPLASIRSAILSARNGGTWDGFGITSATAAMHPSHSTTLGLMEGSDYRAIYGPSATFKGESVDDTERAGSIHVLRRHGFQRQGQLR